MTGELWERIHGRQAGAEELPGQISVDEILNGTGEEQEEAEAGDPDREPGE